MYSVKYWIQDYIELKSSFLLEKSQSEYKIWTEWIQGLDRDSERDKVWTEGDYISYIYLHLHVAVKQLPNKIILGYSTLGCRTS